MTNLTLFIKDKKRRLFVKVQMTRIRYFFLMFKCWCEVLASIYERHFMAMALEIRPFKFWRSQVVSKTNYAERIAIH